MLFWPRPNMLRFPNRCRILKTTAAKGPSCTGVEFFVTCFEDVVIEGVISLTLFWFGYVLLAQLVQLGFLLPLYSLFVIVPFLINQLKSFLVYVIWYQQNNNSLSFSLSSFPFLGFPFLRSLSFFLFLCFSMGSTVCNTPILLDVR